MNIKNLTSEQYDRLDYYLDKNELLLEQIEDDIYNEEEVFDYIRMIYRDEREYFIEEIKKHNICGDSFINAVVRDEDSMTKYCINNSLYEKEIDYLFDMVCENVYIKI